MKKGNKEDETIWMDMKLNHKGEIANEARAQESTEKSDQKGDIENDAQAQESSEASNDEGCKYCGVSYPSSRTVAARHIMF